MPRPASYQPLPTGQSPLDLPQPLLCQRFVQNFYDWYVPLWNADGGVSYVTHIRALNLRPQNFSPGLTNSLMQDAVMHRKDSSRVTLDGDPFLSGRYYNGSYMIKEITMKDGHCFADMYDLEDPHSEIFVTPELEPAGEDWVFVNFHYPAHDKVKAADLLGILESTQDNYLILHADQIRD